MGNLIRVIISFLLSVTACSPPPEKLIIATAANVQFAMTELTKEFTEESGIPCEVILGSSGQLTAQIKAGAPFEIFVSADMKYPDELFREGLATGKPEIYAYGVLVLWSLSDDIIPSMDVLEDDRVVHIAIANPETAPYGKAAAEALQKNGLYEKVRAKLVYGESIAQVNNFIISRTAEIGFTSRSVVMAPEIKGLGKWIEADQESYVPIAQGVVVIRHEGKDLSGADTFYKFLFSEKAEEILRNSGYLTGH